MILNNSASLRGLGDISRARLPQVSELRRRRENQKPNFNSNLFETTGSSKRKLKDVKEDRDNEEE